MCLRLRISSTSFSDVVHCQCTLNKNINATGRVVAPCFVKCSKISCNSSVLTWSVLPLKSCAQTHPFNSTHAQSIAYCLMHWLITWYELYLSRTYHCTADQKNFVFQSVSIKRLQVFKSTHLKGCPHFCTAYFSHSILFHTTQYCYIKNFCLKNIPLSSFL